MSLRYSEVVIDTSTPSGILLYFRIFGCFSLIVNLLGVILVIQNDRVVRRYKYFLLIMQCLALITDADLTLLVQPVLILPVVGFFTNGPLWYLGNISSHTQMTFLTCLLYLQIASIVSTIVTKHQVIASIGSIEIHPILFWTFVIFYHSIAVFIAVSFYFSSLSVEETTLLIKTKFPNSESVLNIPNVCILDFSFSSFFILHITLGLTMIVTSVIISSYFSINLFGTLRSKKLLISPKNYNRHYIAVTSLMAQAALPLIVIIIPLSILNYLFIEITPNSQDIGNAMITIYSTHSFLSTFIMIISTPYYRQSIMRCFRRLPTSHSTPQMTMIQPIKQQKIKKISHSELRLNWSR